MQQTQTYKLNLIETSDTFSPAPLNENMEKVEAQFSAEAAARQSGDAALSQRVTVLEGRKIVAGTYTGDGINEGQFINLGFTPIAVFVQCTVGAWLGVAAIPKRPVAIKSGGFTASAGGGGLEMNGNGVVYGFLAIL